MGSTKTGRPRHDVIGRALRAAAIASLVLLPALPPAARAAACDGATEQLLRAHELVSLGRLDDARRVLANANAICERFGAWHLLGTVSATLADDAGAAAAFVRAAALASDDVDRANATARLAEALARNGLLDAAAGYIHLALRQQAEPAAWMWRLARHVDDRLLARTLAADDVRHALAFKPSPLPLLAPEQHASLQPAGAPPAPGRTLRLPVRFVSAASAVLDPTASVALQLVGRELAAGLRPGERVRLVAHAAAGDAEDARATSQRRAEAVAAGLVDAVPSLAGRIDAVGRGTAEPLYAGAGEAARRRNRRIELQVP
jgi:outer membrane protein OmpA-like peptidoglycan-associated protein